MVVLKFLHVILLISHCLIEVFERHTSQKRSVTKRQTSQTARDYEPDYKLLQTTKSDYEPDYEWLQLRLAINLIIKKFIVSYYYITTNVMNILKSVLK